MQPRTPLRRVIATNIKEYFPPLLRLLFTLLREKRDGDRITLAPGDHDFAHLLLQQSRPAADRARGDHGAATPAVLLMSGGTTGTPKGVLGTHGAYVMAGLQDAGVDSPRCCAAGDGRHLPAAAAVSRLRPTSACRRWRWSTGNPLALVPNPRDIADLLATIRRVKPAFFNGVPTLYIALLNHPDVQRGKVDFKSIKICFSGAAPLLADTKQRDSKRSPAAASSRAIR